MRYASKLQQAVKSTLHGTTPAYSAHLIVHSSMPSSEWPQHVESLPLMQAISKSKSLQAHNIGISLSTPLGKEPARTTATLYDSIGSLPFPLELSLQTIEALEEFCATRTSASRPTNSPLDLYTCTHAARDCRCGTIGGAVHKRLLADRTKWTSLRDIRVAEISHVGKHIFAGNVLAYPKGDWYGAISPEVRQTSLRVAVLIFVDL
jgi:hypothetical protein